MKKSELTENQNPDPVRGKNKSDNRKKLPASLRGFVSLTVCAAAVLTVSGGFKIADSCKQDRVYAAADSNEDSRYEEAGYELPSGIAGVASGVSGTPRAGMTINRIGTSCEDVIVGQRVQKVTSQAVEMNVSESMATTIDDFDSKVVSSAKLMSDEDYQNLLKIVEAEAGTEDVRGRILVANVIMNRVKYSEFPDNVTDVIWEYNNGVAQFSPVEDGRISEVTVSKETKEAVRQVLEGVDYSEGALFFIQKSAAAKNNISWFDRNLKKLFKHGVHEFYTYPDEVLAENAKAQSTESGQTD